MDVWLLRKVFVGGRRRRYGVAQAEIWWVAQQNRVTPSPFDFGLWTLDFRLGF